MAIGDSPVEPNDGGEWASDRNFQSEEYDTANWDYSRFKHPLPILGPLFGYGEARVRRTVAEKWSTARKFLRRPLTEDEKNALARTTCWQLSYMSYAGPLGVFAGLRRAYRTRHSWRLPFWSMGKDFDPNVVKLPMGKPILQGESAKTFWRALRTGLYTMNGVVFSMCFFASVTASGASYMITKDPRLKEFREAIVTQVQQQLRNRRMQQQQQAQNRADPTGQGQRSAGELWRNHREEIERQKATSDDASPSAADYRDDRNLGNSGQSTADSNHYEQPGWAMNGSSSQRSGPSLPRNTSPSASPQPPQSGLMDDWNDNSPSAPLEKQQKYPASQPSGSAWERIRQQAAGGSEQQSPRAVGAAGSQQEAFSFSAKEEDRQLAYSEAQREFDACVERERQGGDFNGKPRGQNW